jgi:hypothetical protein
MLRIYTRVSNDEALLTRDAIVCVGWLFVYTFSLHSSIACMVILGYLF